jgi:hypothetical protein
MYQGKHDRSFFVNAGVQYGLSSDKEIVISTRRIPTMVYEGVLLLVGTFLVLAIGFWRAAERDTKRMPTQSPELRLKAQ